METATQLPEESVTMSDPQRGLIERLVPRIDRIARRVWSTGGYLGELDEIRSAAYEGACAAAMRANIDDPRSSAYVCKRAWGAAKDARRGFVGRRVRGEYKPPPKRNGRYLQLDDYGVIAATAIMDATPSEGTIPSGVLACLEESEKLVIRGYFELGLNLREIAECSKVTESRISQILKKSLEKLRSLKDGKRVRAPKLTRPAKLATLETSQKRMESKAPNMLPVDRLMALLERLTDVMERLEAKLK